MMPIISSTQTIDHVQVVGDAGNGHIFEGWETWSPNEQEQLLDDLKDVDFAFLQSAYQAVTLPGVPDATEVGPYNDVLALQDANTEQRRQWHAHGLQLLKQGKAAVLVLAGGQGTRLGSSAPKGCYDIGLPSHKSLFQLHSERVLRLSSLAAGVPVRMYIMTSPGTHDASIAHFEAHNYFGLARDQVVFFQQSELPCLTREGKLILEAPGKLARSPDGNGSIYASLTRSGMLQDLVDRGIECLDVVCIDNALARAGDPSFLGYCHSREAEVGCRVVARAHANEKVGVMASRAGKLAVVEYSEIAPEDAAAEDPVTGVLKYKWANVCMHYFSTAWLQKVSAALSSDRCPYHAANKSIPSISGPVPGIKLELFIFDPFYLADKVTLMEVDRSAEFAPVKNAPGSATDSPETAAAAVLTLHTRWVLEAGAQLGGNCHAVEVSPLVSYEGEGLAQLVAGRVVEGPLNPLLQGIKDMGNEGNQS